MKIIISPAKKMKTIDDIDMECTTPIFLSKTDELLQHLQNLSYTDLKSYLKCSDSIAKNTFEQFQNIMYNENKNKWQRKWSQSSRKKTKYI